MTSPPFTYAYTFILRLENLKWKEKNHNRFGEIKLTVKWIRNAVVKKNATNKSIFINDNVGIDWNLDQLNTRENRLQKKKKNNEYQRDKNRQLNYRGERSVLWNPFVIIIINGWRDCVHLTSFENNSKHLKKCCENWYAPGLIMVLVSKIYVIMCTHLTVFAHTHNHCAAN